MLREDQDHAQHRRRVFLLSLWQEQQDGPWRASLRPTSSAERRGFASIESLVAHLLELTAPGPPDIAGPDARASPGGTV